MASQLNEVGLLRWVVLDQAGGGVEARRQGDDGRLIRFEIPVVPGQQIAALAGFGVLRKREKVSRCAARLAEGDHLVKLAFRSPGQPEGCDDDNQQRNRRAG